MRAITDSQHYESIAAAIRDKGYEGSLKPNEMAPAILALATGGGGNISYVDSVKEITPAVYGTKHSVLCGQYSYTTKWKTTITFPEPTTQPYYFVVNKMVGISSYIYIEVKRNTTNNTSQFTASAQSGYDGGTYEIPIGTTWVEFSYGFYISGGYSQGFTYFLSTDGVNVIPNSEDITIVSFAGTIDTTGNVSDDKTADYISESEILISSEKWTYISVGELTIDDNTILQSEGVSF